MELGVTFKAAVIAEDTAPELSIHVSRDRAVCSVGLNDI